MKTSVPLAGIGRNLIPVQTGGTRHIRDQVQHVIGGVFLGNHGRKFGEIGIGFNSEVVDGDVRGCQQEGRGHILLQIVHRLTGQRVHDVQVKSGKSLCRLFHRRQGLSTVMHATQCGQMLVIKALHANR